MKSINQELEKLDNENPPLEIHQSILRRVNYLKMRPFFISILFFFIINSVILSSHINTKLVDAEFLQMLYDLTHDSSLDFIIISILLERFFEIISIEILTSLILNLVGVLYVSRRLMSYKTKM